jgi:hypothetical protein
MQYKKLAYRLFKQKLVHNELNIDGEKHRSFVISQNMDARLLITACEDISCCTWVSYRTKSCAKNQPFAAL